MGIRNSEELVRSEFRTNEEGWPTGGVTVMPLPYEATKDEIVVNLDQGEAIFIRWQDGIVGDEGQNGAFVEDVLEAARQRLQYFNSNPKTRCRENSLAITKIEEALQWLDSRTRTRIKQGVENTYAQHDADPPTDTEAIGQAAKPS